MSCKNNFSEVEGLEEETQRMIEGGSCFDADNAFVQGTKIFDVEEALSFKIVLSNSNEKMYMFYTHNIFDFEDPE